MTRQEAHTILANCSARKTGTDADILIEAIEVAKESLQILNEITEVAKPEIEIVVDKLNEKRFNVPGLGGSVARLKNVLELINQTSTKKAGN